MSENSASKNSTSAKKTAPSGHNQFGPMPEWDLTDLYPGTDSKEFKDGLAKAENDAAGFEEKFKGKLEGLAKSGNLIEAIDAYESLSDLTGRIGSFAYLNYAKNTGDPDRAKFLGDCQEALTNLSSKLIFFSLELNRIDDKVLDDALAAKGDLARYKPWFDELRKAKPFQLEDRVEELFHEKSVTGRGAWNRLFDETMAGLQFDVRGEELGLEATLTLMTDKKRKNRKSAFKGVVKTLNNNARLFTQITNVLAKDKEISDRWRGFEDIADSRHMANSVEREVVDALETSVRAAYPRLSHRYYAMKAKWFGKTTLNAWDRNAPLPTSDDRLYDWQSAKDIVLDAYGNFSPYLAEVAAPFFENGWIDAPVTPGKSPGAFAHPTVPSAHPYLMLNYLGKTRDVMTLAHELGHGVHHQSLSLDFVHPGKDVFATGGKCSWGFAHVMSERSAAASPLRNDHITAMAAQNADCRIVDIGVEGLLHAAGHQSDASLASANRVKDLRLVIGAWRRQLLRRDVEHIMHFIGQGEGQWSGQSGPVQEHAQAFWIGQNLCQHPAEKPIGHRAAIVFFNNAAGMIDEMQIMHTGRACGHASKTAQAAINMMDGFWIWLALLLKQLLDQLDASARAVEFIARQLITWAAIHAITALQTGTQLDL